MALLSSLILKATLRLLVPILQMQKMSPGENKLSLATEWQKQDLNQTLLTSKPCVYGFRLLSFAASCLPKRLSSGQGSGA